MPKTKNTSTRWIVSGISFSFGIIISAVIENYLEGFIKIDAVVLNIVTISTFIIISLILISFASGAGKRLNEAIDRLKVEFRDRMPQGDYYFVDDFESEKVGNYEGKVYIELSKLASTAQKSIHAVTAAVIGDEHHKTKEHPLRSKYFATIEKNIEEKIRNGNSFTYIRILQIPEGKNNLPLEQLLGNTVLKHCNKIIKLRKDSPPHALKVDILTVATERMTGFVIIDDKILIIVMGGIDRNKNPYHAAIFVFRNNPNLIKEYKQHFTELITAGTRITQYFENKNC